MTEKQAGVQMAVGQPMPGQDESQMGLLNTQNPASQPQSYPNMFSPTGMHPGMAQPGMMQPGMAQPGMMQPGMAQPGMMQPGMAQPGMMQPGMAQPGMMQPGMAQPGMAQPGMMQPGMMQPGMMQPGMAQPGMMQPGMMQPGMAQPGFISAQTVASYHNPNAIAPMTGNLLAQPGIAGVAMTVHAPMMVRGPCYKEGCQNNGMYICRALLCCKDYGCGKFMCEQHRGRRCIARMGKHGPPQWACVECEPQAHYMSKVVACVPLSCCCVIFLVMIFVFMGIARPS